MLKYINNKGKIIEFDGKKYFIDSLSFRDYKWDYDTEYNKIKNFNKNAPTTKKLNISIMLAENEQSIKNFNSIFEIFEDDILSKIPGKLYIGDYYYKGYVIESQKQDLLSQNILKLNLTLASDTNCWTKESTFEFDIDTNLSGHGYVYGYPYRYASNGIKSFFNDTFSECNFRLKIFGSATNPLIYIGDNIYKVNYTVNSREYLEIDSIRKTVDLVQVDGTHVSVLNYRDRDHYIFQKIAPGMNYISWNDGFSFEITVFDERSEPLWT